MSFRSLQFLLLWAIPFSFSLTSWVSAQGLALPGVGPINRSMGGAATAAPIDAAGALHWNPAAITGLPTSQIVVGLDLLLAHEELSSSLPANSVLPGVPSVPLAGKTRGEPGVTPIPNVALVHRDPCSRVTLGLGILSVAGFGTNYPASTTNPILTAQPPAGLGVGRIDSRAEILQIVPTVAFEINDQWSFGFAPTVTMARVTASPLLFAPPNDANMDGFPTYSDGSGTRYHWGAGFQVGLFYNGQGPWNLGLAVKSPQWMENLRYRTTDEVGRPTTLSTSIDYPLIVSLGTAYKGFDKLLFALDVRYFDYANADGFRQVGYLPTGEVAGLGWDSVWGLNTGVQYDPGGPVILRCGYSFNESPIGDAETVYNIFSPLQYRHAVYAGTSLWANCKWSLDLTYYHVFEASTTGPIITGLGTIPGSSVTSTVSADALSLGLRVEF